MTTTLTVSYVCCVLVLLGGAAAYLYWELARSVEEDNRELLLHKVQVLSRLVQEVPVNLAGIEQEAEEEAEVSEESASPYLLRVLNPDGSALAETPNMAAVLPVGVFPLPAGSQPSIQSWRSAQGSHYLLAASAAGAGWRIHAAVGVDSSERLLARNRRAIGVVLLAALLLSAPLAAVIARQGLRPVAGMAASAGRVGATQLHLRVGGERWPAELSALAAAFDAMLDRLQGAFERLKQFSADIAHELRTPINNLMGEAQVALGRPRDVAEYQRLLQSALEEHGRLARMIDSMLFIAQAEQDRAPVEMRQLDARVEMESVASFYQALADEQGVRLECRGGAMMPVDPALLRRALGNLLSNALKHTARGGQVTLEARTQHDGVQLSVADDGCGIDPVHLPHLGDRFYRVDAARTDSSAGSGLGLAIVRSVMQMHGGTLHIDSVPGAGTTVTLFFPFAPLRT